MEIIICIAWFSPSHPFTFSFCSKEYFFISQVKALEGPSLLSLLLLLLLELIQRERREAGKQKGFFKMLMTTDDDDG